MTSDLENRMTRLETEARTLFKELRQDMSDVRDELKGTAKEVRDLTIELRTSLVTAGAAQDRKLSTAVEPVRQFSWGVRFIVGIGGLILFALSVFSTVVGIYQMLKNH